MPLPKTQAPGPERLQRPDQAAPEARELLSNEKAGAVKRWLDAQRP